MKRVLTLSTAIVLTIMLVASLSGADLGFTLMMSTSPEHNIARIVLIGALLAIAMTTRPRSKTFRTGLAVISAGVTAYALAQTTNYGLGLFDSMAYVLSGVILMTEALEVEKPAIHLATDTKVNA